MGNNKFDARDAVQTHCVHERLNTTDTFTTSTAIGTRRKIITTAMQCGGS